MKARKFRKFVVSFCVEVEVHQAVFDAVLTDEWRSRFYQLHTPDDVAGHLAFNLLQGTPIRSLDGFADQDEKSASLRWPIQVEDVREIEPKPTPRTHSKRVANDRRKNR